MLKRLSRLSMFALMGAAAIAPAAHAQSASGSDVTIVVTPSNASRLSKPLKIVDRMPMLSPAEMQRLMRSTSIKPPVGQPGLLPEATPMQSSKSNTTGSRRWGTSFLPHTTVTVAGYKLAASNASMDAQAPSIDPYNRTGKLYMIFPGNLGGTCTASLIGKGLLVTAAHCLAKYGGGLKGMADKIFFVPSAFRAGSDWSEAGLNASGPYGAWESLMYSLPACYVFGTCSEQANGVVGSNDVAVVQLKRNSSGQFPWQKGIAYYGYGWNGAGFVSNTDVLKTRGINWTSLTQLGYPGKMGTSTATMGDSMIRTDAPALSYYGSTSYSGTKVHIWGSQQVQGCSGGPNIVNFGQPARLSRPGEPTDPTKGSYRNPNVVVGVSSFGSFKEQLIGSSMFGQTKNFPAASYGTYGAGNIGRLVESQCSTLPGQGAGDSKGACRK